MVKLYVEGGGDTNELRTACREGFHSFITEAKIKNRPRIVACGSRRDAYESYCTAVENGEEAILLVDSEAPVSAQFQQGANAEQWQPWAHLKQRQGDSWDKPGGVTDTDCHLMVQCMESWFIADRDTLKHFFGQHFHENKLPAAANPIEQIGKQQIYNALKDATKDCKSGPYGKGSHSFKILKEISPHIVIAASPWAKRFIDALKKKMDQ